MKQLITLSFILMSHSLFSQELRWEETQKVMLEKMADSLTKNLKAWKVPNKKFKVEKYGAIGDGSHLNTIAIQKAIDDCSKKGGGVVLLGGIVSNMAGRVICTDIVDTQIQYAGIFPKLLKEKFERNGRKLDLGKIEFHVVDAQQLIYQDNLFDLVFSQNALEHIIVDKGN